MKKYASILTCALLIGTISGCTTFDTSSTSTETSKTTLEKNYPIPVVLVNFNILKNISKFLQNVVVLDLIEHC
ncbi:hypothetical protein LGV83_00020, partial [Enterococcus durans]|nr:hypothetical protein [Enterococcus durans]